MCSYLDLLMNEAGSAPAIRRIQHGHLETPAVAAVTAQRVLPRLAADDEINVRARRPARKLAAVLILQGQPHDALGQHGLLHHDHLGLELRHRYGDGSGVQVVSAPAARRTSVLAVAGVYGQA